jgi:phage pi2 protein 07
MLMRDPNKTELSILDIFSFELENQPDLTLARCELYPPNYPHNITVITEIDFNEDTRIRRDLWRHKELKYALDGREIRYRIEDAIFGRLTKLARKCDMDNVGIIYQWNDKENPYRLRFYTSGSIEVNKRIW